MFHDYPYWKLHGRAGTSIGTHQGAVRPTHLQAYLDEFAFRFNRRLSTHRGKLFHRLVEQSVISRPKAVKDFYNTKPQHVEAT
jgi:hypothetical protein